MQIFATYFQIRYETFLIDVNPSNFIGVSYMIQKYLFRDSAENLHHFFHHLN